MAEYIKHTETDEHAHYGVLGMKWGVRRGRTDKAYAKASKKLDKLDRKIEKKNVKTEKYIRKLEKKERSRYADADDIQKARSKAKNAEYKAYKATMKAQKFYKSMEKTFAKTSVSMSPEQRALGKSYADQIRQRSKTKALMI